MLNRIALIEQLNSVTQNLFIDISPEIEIARKAWQQIVNDPAFVYKIRQISTPWLVPDWWQGIGDVIKIKDDLRSYCVLSVDGSQIYPDRHSGTSCFLINIGSVFLEYGKTNKDLSGSVRVDGALRQAQDELRECLPAEASAKAGETSPLGSLGSSIEANGEEKISLQNRPQKNPVALASKPYVFTGDEKEFDGAQATEMVNCRRQEFELQMGLEQSIAIKKKIGAQPFAFLFDGSLIFWHLESKEGNLKELFLHKYLNTLNQLYQEQVLCAGYISLPKSKELVNLIRVQLCNFKIEGCTELEAVNHLVDSSIARFFLQENERTIVFKSNATIGKLYPPHLAPHFFYMDVGAEIVRIEIPAWIAQNEEHLNTIAAIMLDQSLKGRGYPVALAEAHEQAVIKGPDRDFFYHLIGKYAIERKRQQFYSQKSIKKRGIGI